MPVLCSIFACPVNYQTHVILRNGEKMIYPSLGRHTLEDSIGLDNSQFKTTV